MTDEHQCPNCGGLMVAESPDEYCIECLHEDRVSEKTDEVDR